jgi:hypothetical protein
MKIETNFFFMQLKAQGSWETWYNKRWSVESFSNGQFKETGLANSEVRNEKFEKEKESIRKNIKDPKGTNK